MTEKFIIHGRNTYIRPRPYIPRPRLIWAKKGKEDANQPPGDCTPGLTRLHSKTRM
ncbi:uncharacterized protein An04g05520 [Aspergillus niger]|uniref:Contig An04c0170, genomic contig n=2 Tax=Aspergillus niger TaxID=5061 RepID=A2QJ20_ASPNC|nr:uncharacterized protein An04g05520 [Aspergillus niger]CAK38814.1 unnamed protein product [Aspergillus niger]